MCRCVCVCGMWQLGVSSNDFLFSPSYVGINTTPFLCSTIKRETWRSEGRNLSVKPLSQMSSVEAFDTLGRSFKIRKKRGKCISRKVGPMLLFLKECGQCQSSRRTYILLTAWLGVLALLWLQVLPACWRVLRTLAAACQARECQCSRNAHSFPASSDLTAKAHHLFSPRGESAEV